MDWLLDLLNPQWKALETYSKVAVPQSLMGGEAEQFTLGSIIVFQSKRGTREYGLVEAPGYSPKRVSASYARYLAWY